MSIMVRCSKCKTVSANLGDFTFYWNEDAKTKILNGFYIACNTHLVSSNILNQKAEGLQFAHFRGICEFQNYLLTKSLQGYRVRDRARLSAFLQQSMKIACRNLEDGELHKRALIGFLITQYSIPGCPDEITSKPLYVNQFGVLDNKDLLGGLNEKIIKILPAPAHSAAVFRQSEQGDVLLGLELPGIQLVSEKEPESKQD